MAKLKKLLILKNTAEIEFTKYSQLPKIVWIIMKMHLSHGTGRINVTYNGVTIHRSYYLILPKYRLKKVQR